jgi:hypothetical protein
MVITNMATVRNLQFIAGFLIAVTVCISGSYTQRWITKLNSYDFTVVSIVTKHTELSAGAVTSAQNVM